MIENPYSPPNAKPSHDEPERALTCTAMFWLSCVLCMVMIGISVNGGYQYWFYASKMGIRLPASILLETICVAISGLGMFYSALRWRRQRIRTAAVAFACSLLIFFVGPILL